MAEQLAELNKGVDESTIQLRATSSSSGTDQDKIYSLYNALMAIYDETEVLSKLRNSYIVYETPNGNKYNRVLYRYAGVLHSNNTPIFLYNSVTMYTTSTVVISESLRIGHTLANSDRVEVYSDTSNTTGALSKGSSTSTVVLKLFY